MSNTADATAASASAPPHARAGNVLLAVDHNFAAQAHGAIHVFSATTSGSGGAASVSISIGAPRGCAAQIPRAACSPLTIALSTVAILTGLIAQSPPKNRLVMASA